MSRCDSYIFGECTYGACELNSWVEDYWGNATDWVAAARSAGFKVTSIPTVGALCVYASGDGYSSYGHVATVESVNADGTFVVREMNYVGFDEWDNRTSSTYDVEGFILPPGVPAGATGGGGAAAPPEGDAALSSAWSDIASDLNSTIPSFVQRRLNVVSNANQAI